MNLYRSTLPHDGFKRLLEIGTSKRHGYFVFTSNVDGQFQKAGFSSDRIVECHGSIHHFQCAASCSDTIWDGNAQTVNIEETSFRALEPLPKCESCSALARPNILMFGDWSWQSHRADEQQRRFAGWLVKLEQVFARLTVIELGAGNAIPTVRLTSERVSDRLAAKLIRINPREAQVVPDGQIGLPFGALEGIGRVSDAPSVPPQTPEE